MLLDEPASGLDAAARRELDAMLELVAQECTLVCAAHVPGDLPALIGRYLTIDRGRVEAVERDTRERAGRDSRRRASARRGSGEAAGGAADRAFR